MSLFSIIIVHFFLTFIGYSLFGTAVNRHARFKEINIANKNNEEFRTHFPFIYNASADISVISFISGAILTTLDQIFFNSKYLSHIQFDSTFKTIFLFFFICSIIIMVYFTITDYKKKNKDKSYPLTFKRFLGLIVMIYSNSFNLSILLAIPIKALLSFF